ncbi:MAG: hypothetical protein V3W37_06965, partial [Candidatus Binatia bacterium]
ENGNTADKMYEPGGKSLSQQPVEYRSGQRKSGNEPEDFLNKLWVKQGIHMSLPGSSTDLDENLLALSP